MVGRSADGIRETAGAEHAIEGYGQGLVTYPALAEYRDGLLGCGSLALGTVLRPADDGDQVDVLALSHQSHHGHRLLEGTRQAMPAKQPADQVR